MFHYALPWLHRCSFDKDAPSGTGKTGVTKVALGHVTLFPAYVDVSQYLGALEGLSVKKRGEDGIEIAGFVDLRPRLPGGYIVNLYYHYIGGCCT